MREKKSKDHKIEFSKGLMVGERNHSSSSRHAPTGSLPLEGADFREPSPIALRNAASAPRLSLPDGLKRTGA